MSSKVSVIMSPNGLEVVESLFGVNVDVFGDVVVVVVV